LPDDNLPNNQPKNLTIVFLPRAHMQKQERIPNEDLLLILNELRTEEDRDQVAELPKEYAGIPADRQKTLYQELNWQIKIHQTNKVTNPDYHHKIILNNTEEKLYQLNKKRKPGTPETHHLQYKHISDSEKNLYFPSGPDSETSYAFITDTETKYINKLTTASTAGHKYILADHTLPRSRTYVPNPQELQQQIPQVKPALPRTPVRPPQPEKQIQTKGAAALTEETNPKWMNPLNFTEEQLKQLLTDPRAERLLDEHVDELLQQRMENTFLRNRTIPKPTPKPKPKPMAQPGAAPTMAELLAEIQSLKIQAQQSSRPKIATDKEEMMEMKRNMAEMAKIIQRLQGQAPETEVDRNTLAGITGQATLAAAPLVYTLQYPSNIIDPETDRLPLGILKAPAVIATVGIFDPSTNQDTEFKQIWERIQNYTRNHQLYEHEYVDILMAVMKGPAAVMLTDIIRETDGKLKNILDAIQDVYVAHNTIFDEVDELNKFIRPANEHIRATVRRATLVVHKLKNQTAITAWPERKYHMTVAIIKQVIMKETSQHLYAKELECAHVGLRLDINAIVNIIAVHESTHKLIPKHDIRLQYNVNTMQVIDQDTEPYVSIQIATPERRITRSASRDLYKTPTPNKTPPSDSPRSQFRPDRSKSRETQTQLSQRNHKGERDYKTDHSKRYKNNKPNYRRQQSQSPGRTDRQKYQTEGPKRVHYNDKQYNNNSNQKEQTRSSSPYPKRHNTPEYQRKTYGTRSQSPFTKTFADGKNKVTLNFYKCQECPQLHMEGDKCAPEFTALNK